MDPRKWVKQYTGIHAVNQKKFVIDVGYERFLGPEIFFHPEVRGLLLERAGARCAWGGTAASCACRGEVCVGQNCHLVCVEPVRGAGPSPASTALGGHRPVPGEHRSVWWLLPSAPAQTSWFTSQRLIILQAVGKGRGGNGIRSTLSLLWKLVHLRGQVKVASF